MGGKLSRAERENIIRSYMGFEEFDTDVHALDHIEKVRLEDQ